MEVTKQQTPRDREEKLEILELYEESGLSKAQFAKDYGLSYKTFLSWFRLKTDLLAEENDSSFVELKLEDKKPGSYPEKAEGMKLHLQNGLYLELNESVDTEWLGRLIRSL